MKILVFAAFLGVISAQPRPPRPSLAAPSPLVTKIQFFPAAEKLKEKGGEEALQAVVHFGRKTAGDSCAGAIVSDTGEILTARHCIDDCLFDWTEKEGYVKKKPPHTCKRFIDGQEHELEIEVPPIECPNEIERKFKQELSSMCSRFPTSDWAILRTKKPLHRSFKCLGIDSQKPKVTDSVFALGFPIATNRPEGNSTPGALNYSEGEVVEEDRCEFVGKPPANRRTGIALPPNQLPEFREAYLQTTSDSLPGSSGGPLLNARSFELLGVASFGNTDNSDSQECKGASFYQRALHLREKFECKTKRVRPPAAPSSPPDNVAPGNR